jgi:hypothetical protein
VRTIAYDVGIPSLVRHQKNCPNTKTSLDIKKDKTLAFCIGAKIKKETETEKKPFDRFRTAPLVTLGTSLLHTAPGF